MHVSKFWGEFFQGCIQVSYEFHKCVSNGFYEGFCAELLSLVLQFSL